jgi:O-antigen ligase
MLGRFEYWDVAWQMTKQHPILGVGFNMYGPLSGHMILSEGITHPHNGFLHILSELGFVGLTAFAWLSAVAVQEILRVRKQTYKSDLVRVADTLLLGMLVWLPVANVPATTFLFPKPMIVFFALLGARLAIAGNAGSHEVNRRAEFVTTRSSSDERRA